MRATLGDWRSPCGPQREGEPPLWSLGVGGGWPEAPGRKDRTRNGGAQSERKATSTLLAFIYISELSLFSVNLLALIMCLKTLHLPNCEGGAGRAGRRRGWLPGGLLRAPLGSLPPRFPPHLAAQVESVNLAVSSPQTAWRGCFLRPWEGGLGTPFPRLGSASSGRARSPTQSSFFESLFPLEC